MAALAVLGRPLLFASVDADVASAQGRAGRALGVVFLVLLGLAVAATSQITGVLLVFALLLMPAASAQTITARPGLSLALTVAIGLVVVWLGLGIAYFSVYPAGFFVTSISFAIYVGVQVGAWARSTARREIRVSRAARRGRDRLMCSRVVPIRTPRVSDGRPFASSEWEKRLMFSQEFMRNALLAGTFIALACGVSGWFVVLRGQVFAGDALSHVAFPGALAAAAAGVDERVGLFGATIAVGAGIGLLGQRSFAGGRGTAGAAPADDTAIGAVFTFVLGLGVFFLTLFSTSSGGGSGIQAAHTLFGSIFGLGSGEARLAAVIGLAAVLLTLVIARPLLFASVSPDVAGARGVPTRLLGIGFVMLLGVVAAEATQAVGALLLLGLLAAPAAAAHRLAGNPYAGIALGGLLAVVAMWAGLALGYAVPGLPPSTAIVTIAVGIYYTSTLVA